MKGRRKSNASSSPAKFSANNAPEITATDTPGGGCPIEQPVPPPRQDPIWTRVVLIALLLFITYLAFRMLQSFLNVIILAILSASFASPLRRWLLLRLKDRRTLAAGITTVVIILTGVLPVTVFTIALVNQTASLVQISTKWIQEGHLDKLLSSPRLERWVAKAEEHLGVDISDLDIMPTLLRTGTALGQKALQQTTSIISNVTSFIMNFILFVLLLFYVLRDGDRLLAWIMHLSPLSASHENRLLDRIREISKSAIFGILLTSAAQGLTAGIGLAITGIPGLFWGTMTALASLVPVVGTTLILVPAAGYLLLTGHAFKALFLIIWSVVMVGSIDNFLRPWLMQGQSKMSPVILFLAILGGIRAFGLLGLIYGPLVFGLLAIILYIYELEFATYLASQDKR